MYQKLHICLGTQVEEETEHPQDKQLSTSTTAITNQNQNRLQRKDSLSTVFNNPAFADASASEPDILSAESVFEILEIMSNMNYSTKSPQNSIIPDTRTPNEGSRTSNIVFGVDKATSPPPPLVTIYKQPAMVISDSSEAEESESATTIKKSSKDLEPFSSEKMQQTVLITQDISTQVADANLQISSTTVIPPRSLVTSLLNLSIVDDKLTQQHTERLNPNMGIFDCMDKVISVTESVVADKSSDTSNLTPELHSRMMDRTNCHGDGMDFRGNGTSEYSTTSSPKALQPAAQFEYESELSESLSEGEVGRKSSASIGECSTIYRYGYRRSHTFAENRGFYRQSNVASYYVVRNDSPGEWDSNTDSSGMVRQ